MFPVPSGLCARREYVGVRPLRLATGPTGASTVSVRGVPPEAAIEANRAGDRPPAPSACAGRIEARLSSGAGLERTEGADSGVPATALSSLRPYGRFAPARHHRYPH